ncbi:MAG: leucine-rich repeat domain-containing protein, partial [Lachnospiraceae bacterium]|nr:leucine-rich repeat domain-containing protein [Lachnospiraceae bacterium]
LKTVTFPGRLGNGATDKMIPDNTLAGCTGLECAIFPDGAYDADYVPGELFKDVMNEEFYVRGPEHGASRDTKATPRQRTWRAVPGYKLENGEPGVVPYMFTDDAGVEHIEIGVGQENRDDYIATIDIVDDSTAILSGYEENNKSEFDSIAVEIPATVGKYTITEIADNCFGSDVKDKIYKVIITDGTVQKINASAFENCKKLQWVELGDSVSYIGENAFAGCTSLENVIFSQTKTGLYGDDDNYWTEALTIEENAFKTGSDFLIFHGAVHPSYAPFKLAMSDEGKSMTGTSLQICYKTDAPTNLTILRDNASGESTLIDYPHYEEIDTVNAEIIKKWANGDSGYSITDKFEEWNDLRGTNNYKDRPYNTNGYYNEEDIVLYTLFMNIPKGVDSIDANAYYNNSANASDIAYLTRTYTPETRISSRTGKEVEVAINGSDNAPRNINNVLTYGRYGDVKSVYSQNDYIAQSDLDELGVTAGLFSGFLAESSFSGTVARLTAPDDTTSGIIWRTYNGHDYVENSIIGNDNLTTIDLTSVNKLPDYAFMSCENLLRTSYGAEMQYIGALPYRNCRNLTQIDIPATNPYVLFGNMILYTTDQANKLGGLEIVECLEGRGNNSTTNSPFKVGEDSGDTYLSDVVSIAKEAFSYCDEITEADLSTTSITVLPERCFYKAEKLDTVKLPDSIAVIGEEAFLDTNSNRIEVTIPNPQCA